ncbi:MAG: OmpH family outer membrane protein [Prevotella sp.]|nr:OmpH family outer membrane protein [Prevotella sp.]MBR3078216.1 OmpH family outer membrane protein [Prevotella sp.]
MKRIVLVLMMALMGLAGYAQTNVTSVKYGYLSYDSVMKAMPEYAQMQSELAELRSQYEAEQKRVEDDFNKKYEEFLDGQASFPKTILQKRQGELQEMLDKNIAFKKESQKMLCEAEANLQESFRGFINMAVETIGKARGYAFILNTDKDALPFINPEMGEDITKDVKALLQK